MQQCFFWLSTHIAKSIFCSIIGSTSRHHLSGSGYPLNCKDNPTTDTLVLPMLLQKMLLAIWVDSQKGFLVLRPRLTNDTKIESLWRWKKGQPGQKRQNWWKCCRKLVVGDFIKGGVCQEIKLCPSSNFLPSVKYFLLRPLSRFLDSSQVLTVGARLRDVCQS